ncbi:hypothetical protein NL676_008549 [Syzygium grande]|nr:hypothetical protein NL676_008549 [Syzygium grande]
MWLIRGYSGLIWWLLLAICWRNCWLVRDEDGSSCRPCPSQAIPTHGLLASTTGHRPIPPSLDRPSRAVSIISSNPAVAEHFACRCARATSNNTTFDRPFAGFCLALVLDLAVLAPYSEVLNFGDPPVNPSSEPKPIPEPVALANLEFEEEFEEPEPKEELEPDEEPMESELGEELSNEDQPIEINSDTEFESSRFD